MPTLSENFTPGALTPQWTAAPAQLPLAPGETHLWRANLDSPRLLRLANDVLSAQEIVQSERCPIDQVRSRQLALSALIRSVLARYLAVTPESLHFRRGLDGRLGLALSTLRFAFGSAENLALMAVGASGEI